jgi:hypothetical protein
MTIGGDAGGGDVSDASISLSNASVTGNVAIQGDPHGQEPPLTVVANTVMVPDCV